MKRIYTVLLVSFILSMCAQNANAQFVVAQDTVRGRIDFCPRLGDLHNAVEIPNDSVFYMLPIDQSTDPWRQVYRYMPDRSVSGGYIHGRKLMRVDDYDIVEVERLSAHGKQCGIRSRCATIIDLHINDLFAGIIIHNHIFNIGLEQVLKYLLRNRNIPSFYGYGNRFIVQLRRRPP